MITRLEEKGRKKADRYWPSKKKKFEFENGIRVKQTSERLCDKDLTKRGFEVSCRGIFVDRKDLVNENDKMIYQDLRGLSTSSTARPGPTWRPERHEGVAGPVRGGGGRPQQEP